jgi:hypothetical protein
MNLQMNKQKYFAWKKAADDAASAAYKTGEAFREALGQIAFSQSREVDEAAKEYRGAALLFSQAAKAAAKTAKAAAKAATATIVYERHMHTVARQLLTDAPSRRK